MGTISETNVILQCALSVRVTLVAVMQGDVSAIPHLIPQGSMMRVQRTTMDICPEEIAVLQLVLPTPIVLLAVFAQRVNAPQMKIMMAKQLRAIASKMGIPASTIARVTLSNASVRFA